MLEEVRIRNLGVIADATLPLGPGLTVVTGETGAGKTMVVAGLGLLFGARSDAGQVGRAQATADVEGTLTVSESSPSARRCRDAGGDLDDGRLILSRTISTAGRSRASAGGRSVPVGVLSEIGEHELTVHGQASQLRLARAGEQLRVLDRFGGTAHARLLQDYRDAYGDWRQVVDQLADLQRDDAARHREVAMLRFGLDQIDRAEPLNGEDDRIDAEVRRLANADELRQRLAVVTAALGGSEDAFEQTGADAAVGQAARALADSDDPDLRPLAKRLEQVGLELRDVLAEVGAYAAGIEDNPPRLAELMSRKAELKELIRSYSTSADLAGVLRWADQARASLAELDTSTERLEALRAECNAAQLAAAESSFALSAARTALAGRLQKAINKELASLALGGSHITVEVTPRPVTDDAPQLGGAGASEHGCDRVRILLAHADGATGRPLERGASGGELSRIMLAVEVVLAGTDPVPTMVFDEVDAGVGGEAAIEIGRRLATLSREHQVIVVTHLPQVAAYADRHVKITKHARGGIVASGIGLLTDDERVTELTRMLAGLTDSDSGRAHASELLGAADHDKKRRTRR